MEKELINNYKKELLKRAWKLTRNRECAQDLVQETFLKAVTKWETFDASKGHYDPNTNLRNWLHQIMKNLFINEYLRKCTRPPTMSLDPFFTRDYSKTGMDVSNTVVAKEYSINLDDEEKRFDNKRKVILIRKKIKHLNKKIIKTAELYIEQLEQRGEADYAYMAEFLRIPIGTVKSRIHRIRKHLGKDKK